VTTRASSSLQNSGADGLYLFILPLPLPLFSARRGRSDWMAGWLNGWLISRERKILLAGWLAGGWADFA